MDSAVPLLAVELGKLLRRDQLTLSVAESCTGGLLGAAITAIAGASDYFAGGVIAYDNRIKTGLLHVPSAMLDQYGAVSAEVATAMARGVRELFGTDCAIAVSGVAGPTASERKPVGLVFIGISTGRTTIAYEYRFPGTLSRDEIRDKSVEAGVRRLIERL
jgi:PncC family amidohydrolase